MLTIQSIEKLREILAAWRSEGLRTALVPTMGNLHQGHLTLVETAKKKADRLVVSLFVNPTQFGEGEDFDNYPRTEQQDAEHLMRSGVDVLFMPEISEIYPAKPLTVVSVPELSALHCGKTRVGHFDGVATVVSKLFNLVQPNIAAFGRKDYQQLAIIKKMVADLNFPLDILSVDTVREPDGLAMSSRNGYLNAQERQAAPFLYQCLLHAKEQIIQQEFDFQTITRQKILALQDAGFAPEYFNICCADNLLPVDEYADNLVVLAAARLGRTRLIDNIEIISS